MDILHKTTNNSSSTDILHLLYQGAHLHIYKEYFVHIHSKCNQIHISIEPKLQISMIYNVNFKVFPTGRHNKFCTEWEFLNNFG